MYKALGILLLLSGLIAGLVALYDAGGDAREDRLVREWQEERLALIQAKNDAMLKAADNRVQREIVYRDKIKTVYQIRDNCLDTAMPAELLKTFCDIGLAGKDLCESSVTR
jgi:hypothetical protein